MQQSSFFCLIIIIKCTLLILLIANSFQKLQNYLFKLFFKRQLTICNPDFSDDPSDLLYIENENFSSVKIIINKEVNSFKYHKVWLESFIKNKNKNITKFILSEFPNYNESIQCFAKQILNAVRMTVQDISIDQGAFRGELQFIGDSISSTEFPALKTAGIGYDCSYHSGDECTYNDSVYFSHPDAKLCLNMTSDSDNVDINLGLTEQASLKIELIRDESETYINMPNIKDIILDITNQSSDFIYRLPGIQSTKGQKDFSGSVVVIENLNPKVQTIKMDSNKYLRKQIIKKYKYLVQFQVKWDLYFEDIEEEEQVEIQWDLYFKYKDEEIEEEDEEEEDAKENDNNQDNGEGMEEKEKKEENSQNIQD